MSLDLAMSLRMGTKHGKHGGGPPPGYTTAAVHFDGATQLYNASLAGAVDSGLLSFSLWIKATLGGNTWDFFALSPASDGSGNYSAQLNISTLGEVNLLFASAGFAQQYQAAYAASTFPMGQWVNVRGKVNTNLGAGSKTAQLFIGNAAVSPSSTVDNDAAFLLGFAAQDFAVPDVIADGPPTADMADVWIAAGQAAAFVAAGDAFISIAGKPVDLGADGSTPTGTAPTIFQRRAPSAAASTFATNLGTGGNFTITGTLTAASSSPSD